MQLKGIIFDFDGTLADTLPAIFAAFRHCLRGGLNRDFSNAEIEALFGPTEEGILKKLLPQGWEACYAGYLAEYRKRHPQSAFAGIEQALRLLRDSGVRLAIGTGKGSGSLNASLEIIGLRDYFELLEVGSDAGAVKPEIIGRIISRWQLPSDEVAYVGDVPSDVIACRIAGVVALSAAWSDTADLTGIKAEHPDAVFSTVAEFVEWVRPKIAEENVD